MSIRIDDWFVAGNAQKTNSDWNATSGFAQILNKPENLVHTDGNETISGIKTFSSIPISVTPATTSNDTSVATTAFVNSKISTHNNDTSSHSDIRQNITTVNNNIATSINSHNISNSSHSDIRQLISDTNTSIDTKIGNHNNSALAHSDIRQLISDNGVSITTLTNDLSNETNQRTNEVTSLQQQIDALSSKGDVTDIVGTYQDLLNYDTSTLLNKSIIKVLTDSTHDNASSYYKWNTGTSAFDYVGSESPTYTKAEIDTMDSNVVHKTGNENVGGVKTFTSTPVISGGVGANEGGELHLSPVNNNASYAIGIIDIYAATPSDSTTHRVRLRLSGGSEGLCVYEDGAATCTSPAASDNIASKSIATVGWVSDPAKSTNLVHRTGDETIGGNKTFTQNVVTQDAKPVQKYTTSSSAEEYTLDNARALRSNGDNWFFIGAQKNKNTGSYYQRMGIWNDTNSDYAAINVGWTSSGTKFTDAPTPPAGSNDGNIATTAWCYDPAKSTNLVHRTGDETIGGTKTFSSTINGTAYRAQWGDLAEYYLTDEKYPKGTLVQFGGEKEITIANNKVNAVITSEPGFILNGELENSQAIALIGRVPVRVIGKIKKFDKITLSYIDGVGCANNDSETPIGIALEDKNDSDEGLIICSVKLSF